jgi:hypothetical protein
MGVDVGSNESAASTRRGMMARYFTFVGDLLSATWPRLSSVIAAMT